MDFLLVFSEWIDLGFTGMGLVLGAVVYRRRALLTDTLWWVREVHRQHAIAQIIVGIDPERRQDPAVVLRTIEDIWGRPLTGYDARAAHYLLRGINYQQEEESHEDPPD